MSLFPHNHVKIAYRGKFMSVFPEKSLKIYHFALFGLTSPRIRLPPPLGNGLGGVGGGKNLGGGAMPTLPPHLSRL